MKQVYFLLAAFFIAILALSGQDHTFSRENLIVDFEDLPLDPESYWNGSDGSGGFESGPSYFPNNYIPDWFSWSGWSYSNMGNDSTPGYGNMYSAITAGGIDTAGSGVINYGVSWISSDFMTGEPISVSMKFKDLEPHQVDGFYVTNTTYAALSMELGDDFAKKFGGESGDDPDYFVLHVWGILNGLETDTVDFYLADYRYEDNSQDYIVNTWEWMDLSSLGKVDSLMLILSSSDEGAFGINTPTYFCVDNIHVFDEPAIIRKNVENSSQIYIYPNPADGRFAIDHDEADRAEVSIYDLFGKMVYHNPDYEMNEPVDISKCLSGVYVVKFNCQHFSVSEMIIKY